MIHTIGLVELHLSSILAPCSPDHFPRQQQTVLSTRRPTLRIGRHKKQLEHGSHSDFSHRAHQPAGIGAPVASKNVPPWDGPVHHVVTVFPHAATRTRLRIYCQVAFENGFRRGLRNQSGQRQDHARRLNPSFVFFRECPSSRGVVFIVGSTTASKSRSRCLSM